MCLGWVSRKWHAELNKVELQEKIQKELKERKGYVRNWNTLVDERSYSINDKQIDIKPITSVINLFEEGKAMSHCVATYDDHCVVGRSKIFQIYVDGEHVATTELRKRGNEWRAVQTRGKHNQKPPEEALLAARELSKEYRELYPSTKNQHQVWLEHYETGEVKPLREKKKRKKARPIPMPLREDIDYANNIRMERSIRARIAPIMPPSLAAPRFNGNGNRRRPPGFMPRMPGQRRR